MKKITGPDAGQLYAMKVLKKATLKGRTTLSWAGEREPGQVREEPAEKEEAGCSVGAKPNSRLTVQ